MTMQNLRPLLGDQVRSLQGDYKAKIKEHYGNPPHGNDDEKSQVPPRGERHVPDEVWVNDIYEVFVYRGDKANLRATDGSPTGFPEMIWLSIKRYDRKPIHDWRDFQSIKNQVVGKEHDALEIYPKESRLVDMANQYHLWVIADPKIILPVGFIERSVGTSEEARRVGATQR